MARFCDQFAESDVVPAFVYLARSGQMRIVRSQGNPGNLPGICTYLLGRREAYLLLKRICLKDRVWALIIEFLVFR